MIRVAIALVLLGIGSAPVIGAAFTDASITLPDDVTTLPPGPHVDLVTANCTACHSSDMILNQPRLTRAQWEANVDKMVKVYKASIDPNDVPQIVDYLVATNERLAK